MGKGREGRREKWEGRGGEGEGQGRGGSLTPLVLLC